jgi:hypothetical protein
VVIEWVPPPLNQTLRQHWTAYRKARRLASSYLKLYLGAAPEAWSTGGRVRVRVQMYRRRQMDQDGANGACKPLFDSLVELGWARDDSPASMDQQVAVVIVDRQRPRTEISLTEGREGGVRARLRSGAKRTRGARGDEKDGKHSAKQPRKN